MAKRILALLLVLCMTAAFVPAGASAHPEQELGVNAMFRDDFDVLVPMTQCRTEGFASGYKLSGNGAADMVAIALAQEGRTGRQFGYTEDWCANFVSDCAILAGQGAAVPQYGGVAGLKDNIMKAGGVITTSKPQPGDICFIDWNKKGGYKHAEIVYAVSGKSVFTIGGNSGSGSSLYTRYVKKHDPLNPDYITCIVRPKYAESRPSEPKMWFENSNMQETLAHGKGFAFTGDLFGNNGVKRFSLVIYDSSRTAVQAVHQDVSSTSYKISCSVNTLAKSLDFSKLGIGTYTLAVESVDRDQTRYSAYTKNFSVVCYHTYTSSVLAPTCTKAGYTKYTCTICGGSYTDSHTDARGHSYKSVVTAPTCTAEGYTTHKCTVCGSSYVDSCTKARGHSYKSVVTASTCTTTGYTTHKCTGCGRSYVDAKTAVLGHNWAGTDCTRCDATRDTHFIDVPNGFFYAEPVRWAVENGITNGTSENAFSPDSNCNRAAVVTFLWRAAGCPDPKSSKHPFVDVLPGSYYEKAVLWAVENGITNGVDATHFGPNASCNRAQVVTFLFRAQQDPRYSTADCPFTDVASGAWYEAPILWAVENGVTNGMGNGTFGSDQISNRAQVVTFLYRTYVN